MSLFSVIVLDLALVMARGGAALVAGGELPPATPTHVVAIGVVALLVVTALSTNWSYSVAALRQPAAQIGKALTAVAIVTPSVSGVLHLVGAAVITPHATLAWAAGTVVALAFARMVEARTTDHLASRAPNGCGAGP